jgi:PHS family inorganic phosphate transporter-like MFS transporter
VKILIFKNPNKICILKFSYTLRKFMAHHHHGLQLFLHHQYLEVHQYYQPRVHIAYLTRLRRTGCIIGMVLIGLLGDIFGRITAFVIALSCASLGALLSAYGSYGNVQTLCWLIALWRVILGIGIGGIYPISSVFAYEYDDDNESDGEKTTESSKRELIDGSTRSAMALFWQLPGKSYNTII